MKIKCTLGEDQVGLLIMLTTAWMRDSKVYAIEDLAAQLHSQVGDDVVQYTSLIPGIMLKIIGYDPDVFAKEQDLNQLNVLRKEFKELEAVEKFLEDAKILEPIAEPKDENDLDELFNPMYTPSDEDSNETQDETQDVNPELDIYEKGQLEMIDDLNKLGFKYKESSKAYELINSKNHIIINFGKTYVHSITVYDIDPKSGNKVQSYNSNNVTSQQLFKRLEFNLNVKPANKNIVIENYKNKDFTISLFNKLKSKWDFYIGLNKAISSETSMHRRLRDWFNDNHYFKLSLTVLKDGLTFTQFIDILKTKFPESYSDDLTNSKEVKEELVLPTSPTTEDSNEYEDPNEAERLKDLEDELEKERLTNENFEKHKIEKQEQSNLDNYLENYLSDHDGLITNDIKTNYENMIKQLYKNKQIEIVC